jgi:hypothetical protein
MSHAYKKVAKQQPQPFSFVAAVKRSADMWWINAPRASRDPVTRDQHERALMWLMERGSMSRVGELADPSDEDMLVHEHGFGYCAVREGYDGAPDSHCPIGVGRTRFQAIADLLDAEELRNG